MGIADVFKAKQYKDDVERLTQENIQLQSMLTPEMQDVTKIKQLIESLEATKSELETYNNKLLLEKNELITVINDKKNQIIWMDEEILVQDFGLYKPKFAFANSDIYKEKLSLNRSLQKEAIKNGTAVTGNTNWTVNGDKKQGTKMVKDMQKLLLRAFNSECDELVDKVKYNNYDASLKRLDSSREAISKLGTIMGVSITNTYYRLKIEELQMALEFAIKKQEEKEELKAAREELREAAKLQKEIEEQRRKIEKEQTHYQTALINIMKAIEKASEDERAELEAKKAEIEKELGDIEIALKDIDYREANQKAGYVYVISNIGAFGENVYKIGMTRRLEPQERVDELGDASVPFSFDVHAMIFSDNAPALENALHKAFENRKINMVNQRKEFFNVSLEEIKEVVKKNFDKTVEFFDTPEANQYRISREMKKENSYAMS